MALSRPERLFFLTSASSLPSKIRHHPMNSKRAKKKTRRKRRRRKKTMKRTMILMTKAGAVEVAGEVALPEGMTTTRIMLRSVVALQRS